VVNGPVTHAANDQEQARGALAERYPPADLAHLRIAGSAAPAPAMPASAPGCSSRTRRTRSGIRPPYPDGRPPRPGENAHRQWTRAAWLSSPSAVTHDHTASATVPRREAGGAESSQRREELLITARVPAHLAGFAVQQGPAAESADHYPTLPPIGRGPSTACFRGNRPPMRSRADVPETSLTWKKRPASRLSPAQLSKLYAIITGSDPRQLEFDFGLWTRKIIRELIRREFGVKFSEVQVGRLLKRMGLSPQRPLYRACQQDPERVEEWKKSAHPKIRKLAAEEGASVFFADEASIRTDHHAGTTWAPVGQAPVVITAGERKSVNMISAISPRGELRFRVQEGKMNAEKFIDFLKALLDSVPGKIFLIVDGHPVHKAKRVSEFVKEKADGRLSIFFLPPYSPELNPDEWVWNNVKNDRISRGVIMSANDLKAKAIGALRRLQKLPGIVRGFLRDPKLAYILESRKRTVREVYKLNSSLVTLSMALES